MMMFGLNHISFFKRGQFLRAQAQFHINLIVVLTQSGLA
jgi:hypothetical protein